MSTLWKAPVISELGTPQVPAKFLLQKIPAKLSTWIHDVNVDSADMFFPLWGDLNQYIKSEAPPEKCCPHFMSYDSGTIDPLWKEHLFTKRVTKMTDYGIDKVVAAEFSTWTDWPIMAQMESLYKTARTAYRFGNAGLKVIPNILWCAPQLDDMAMSIWPDDMPIGLLDLNHLKRTDNMNPAQEDTQHFLRGFDMLNDKWPDTQWICYVGNKSILPVLGQYFGKRAILIRSRAKMMRQYFDAMRKAGRTIRKSKEVIDDEEQDG